MFKTSRIALLLSVAALSVSIFAGAPVSAKDAPESDVDRISLAALLIRDGHYDRARIVLAQVDESRDGIDLARLFTLRGLVALHDRDLAGAKAGFLRAVKEGQTEPIVHVYLAQIHFELREYREALSEIAASGESGRQMPEVFLMASQSHWELGEKAAAWGALDDGLQVFPDQSSLVRRKVFLLIELGLYREAASLGRAHMARSETSPPEDALAVANSLRRSGQPREAAQFLEAARVRIGPNRDFSLELAHAYLDLGWTHTAAAVLEEDSGRFPDLASEAAELYRRAGRLHRALTLNARVHDQSKKLKQRLALLLDMERYDQAASMKDDLLRVGLMEDQEIRYAVAYALFRTKQYDQAEANLNRLSNPLLFEKAAEIRRAMDDCRHAAWRCN